MREQVDTEILCYITNFELIKEKVVNKENGFVYHKRCLFDDYRPSALKIG